VEYRVRRMTQQHAHQICGFAYPKPYTIYDMGESQDVLRELLEDNYYAVVDLQEALCGYVCFGEAARTPGGHACGAYRDEHALDIGLGMRPDLTGKGMGYRFMCKCIRFARTNFRPPALRLSVLCQNERAIKVYERAGFTKVMKFSSDILGVAHDFWAMRLRLPKVFNALSQEHLLCEDWEEQVAFILHACFPGEDGWPTVDSARKEIRGLLQDACCFLVAQQESRVVGLVAALSQYRGHVWELHPLAVAPDSRMLGTGAALVDELENEARRKGVQVILLGADDIDESTAIGGKQVFPGVLDWAKSIDSTPAHAVGFYMRLGYEVCGVVPCANGPGKPDILMVKCL